MPDTQPTLAALRHRIAALSPEKRALLEKQLKQQGLSWPEATITPQARPEWVPLSAAQAHLWVLHQLDPQSAAYHIPMSWRFAGPLDITLVERSFQTIAQRHESLRTVFVRHPKSGHPYQHIEPKGSFRLAQTDWRQRPCAEAEADVQRLASQEARQPFDISTGPLWRGHLVRLEDRLSVLILVLHHMIADGWSRGVLMREFAALYSAACRGEVPDLAPLPVQYADYALWQHQWLQGPDSSAHLDYWRQQLADLPVLELPGDRPRGAAPDPRSRTCTITLSPACTSALKALSRQCGTTLFTTLLAAFNVLLHRYSGQDEQVVGVPVANRHDAEVEPLIGFFVNTLVLHTRTAGNLTFGDFLAHVKQVVGEALQHQEIPFSQVVDALHLERDLSRNPLFQVMFQLQSDSYQLQNAAMPELDLPDLTISQAWIDPGHTKFDMTWHLIERADTLMVVVEYRTALFDAARIRRMLQHFQTLLDAIVADPARRLSELTMLSPAERQQLLIAWNRTETTLPLHCFHEAFAQQIQRSPDAIAVRDSHRQLTYQALNQQANKLAARLRQQGIGPERLVGICLRRSVDLVIALLGVLKAGGAYLPLDPALPQERLRFMLQDAGVAAIVAEEATWPLVESCAPVVMLNLSHDWQPDVASHDGPSPVSLDHLAYVLYTSGSTGRPKGTLVTHRGLANYLYWSVQAYAVATGGGAPVQSSVGFDATITSLYTPLLAGQTVHLLPEGHEVETLYDVLQDAAGYSLIKLTPAHLRALHPLIAPAAHPPKAFVIGGEALQARDVAFWQQHAPEVRLVNEYGPTETVVGCCTYTLPRHGEASGAVPIGRPIANVQLYILDAYLQPVPIGVPGELYIGGAGVARGYLNRPDLTAERFIPNPFASAGQAASTVLYKTGDRAQYRADGVIEYLGRVDDQVNLRGFRVELGEIEAGLRQCAQVAQAAVVLRTTPSGTSQLVAYVVLDTDPQQGNSASPVSERVAMCRQQLRQQLPAYMIPARFVVLDAMPLTANGKIDRQALPELTAPEAGAVAPRHAREAQLAVIWQQVLGRETIGIHDNFFELGGDSILGMQIIARAHEIGLHLTPRQLFQYQSIAELAAVAEAAIVDAPSQEPVTGPAPLTPMQHDFFAQDLPEPQHFNQALLLEVDLGLRVDSLAHALQHLTLHHDALRLRFHRRDGKWQQVHAAPHEVRVPMHEIDFAEVSDDERQAAFDKAVHDLQTGLNLSAGPLLQGALIHLGPIRGDRLLLVAHHLLVDGVSWRILLDDLSTAYRQLTAGEAVHLPPKTTSFQTWATHLWDNRQHAALSAQRPYWLTACATPSRLPVDAPHGYATNTVATLEQITVRLSAEQTRVLLEALPQAYQTRVEDVLLTALGQTLSQWGRTTTLLIDLEHHGRLSPVEASTIDLSRTVGWLTSVFPCRLVMSPGSVAEQLQSVQDQLRDVPHQGTGYGMLRYLSSPADADLLSHAEIAFNYLGHLDMSTERVSGHTFFRGLARESVGALRHAAGMRRYVLEVVALIAAGQLQIVWRYSRHLHQPGTIEQLAQRYLTALHSILAYGQERQPRTASYTPADFPAARLNQAQLDRLLSTLHQREP